MRVQHGADSPLETGLARDRRRRDERWHDEHAGEIDELTGIRAAVDAQAQHGIIGGLLAFLHQPAAQPEHERIEPVDGAQDFRGHLRDPVEPLDMGKLMPEHDSDPVDRPVAGGSREQDPRPDESPRREQRGIRRVQQCDRSPEAVGARQFRGGVVPRTVRDRRRARRDPGEARQSRQQNQQADTDAEQPHVADQRRGAFDQRRGVRRPGVGRGDGQILNRRKHAVRVGHGREMPRRNDELQERHHGAADDGNREDPVPHGGGSPTQKRSGAQRDRGDDRDLDGRAEHESRQPAHRDSSFAFFTSAAIRFS